ncbi:hypothetical protein KM043_008332 [Ampulex compressa]|nr:hypothetical protein KM043_008332 [Ampulex compressa]
MGARCGSPWISSKNEAGKTVTPKPEWRRTKRYRRGAPINIHVCRDVSGRDLTHVIARTCRPAREDREEGRRKSNSDKSGASPFILQETFSYVKRLVSCEKDHEDSRGRGVILNQTSRNKGCCDLKGPWDHSCVCPLLVSSWRAKKKSRRSSTEESRGEVDGSVDVRRIDQREHCPYLETSLIHARTNPTVTFEIFESRLKRANEPTSCSLAWRVSYRIV